MMMEKQEAFRKHEEEIQQPVDIYFRLEINFLCAAKLKLSSNFPS